MTWHFDFISFRRAFRTYQAWELASWFKSALRRTHFWCSSLLCIQDWSALPLAKHRISSYCKAENGGSNLEVVLQRHRHGYGEKRGWLVLPRPVWGVKDVRLHVRNMGGLEGSEKIQSEGYLLCLGKCSGCQMGIKLAMLVPWRWELLKMGNV